MRTFLILFWAAIFAVACQSTALAKTEFVDGNKTITVTVEKGTVTRVVFPEYIKENILTENHYLDLQIHGEGGNTLYVMPHVDPIDQIVWVNTQSNNFRLHIKTGNNPAETIMVVGTKSSAPANRKVSGSRPHPLRQNPYDCLIRALDNGPSCPGASGRDMNVVLIDDGFITVRARKGLSLGHIRALEAEVSLKKNMTLYLPGHAWPFNGAKRTSMQPERLYPQPGMDKGSLILVWDENEI